MSLAPLNMEEGGLSKMKKVMWSVVLALVLCVGLVTRTVPEQGILPPDIAFSEELWDFGVVKQGEKVTHVFEVKNLGETELVIEKVRPSCGCTAALLSSPEITPGSSSQIKVSFDSSGFKGRVSKYIYVESNDPDEPLKNLTITAIVEVPSQPIIELLATIEQREKDTTIIKLENRGEKKIQIVRINGSSELIAITPSSIEIDPDEEARINVTLDPRKETGPMEEYLYLTIALPLDIVVKEVK